MRFAGAQSDEPAGGRLKKDWHGDVLRILERRAHRQPGRPERRRRVPRDCVYGRLDREMSRVAPPKLSNRHKDGARLRRSTKIQAKSVPGVLWTGRGPQRVRVAVGQQGDIDGPAIVGGGNDGQRIAAAQRRWRRWFGREVLPAIVWSESLHAGAAGEKRFPAAVVVSEPVDDDQRPPAGRETVEDRGVVLTQRGPQREIVRRLETAV